MTLILLSTILYVLIAFCQLFFKNDKSYDSVLILNFVPSLLALVPAVLALTSGREEGFIFNAGPIIGSVELALDSLSGFFVLIIAFISLLVLIYGRKYLHPYENHSNIKTHLFLFNVFVASMIFVTICQNALFFLISWEIMSLSSFFLMLYDGKSRETRKTAVRYFVTMHFGVLFLTIGFILLNIKTHSLNFSDYQDCITDLIFILLLVGFGIKAGFSPLHTWLPKAHPVAPTHISALMSGVMIKTGIYGILRILTLCSPPTLLVSYLILLIGLTSAFFGILYSICQRDFKKMLAYSSIENMGIAAIALSIGCLGLAYQNNTMASLGFLGMFLHLLNHSIFKPLLFLSAGNVYKQTGTKDIEKLGGLIKKMPQTGICFLIGSLAISALPPFNGFVGEFLIYLGLLNSFSTTNFVLIPVTILTLAIMAFVGAMALIAFTNAFSIMFLGTQRTEIYPKETPFCMRAPLYILSALALFIGLFPQYAVNFLSEPVEIFAGFNPQFEILSNVSQINIVLIVSFACIFGFRAFLLRGKIARSDTWACGYDKITPRIQYTVNSFTRPFLGFLTPFYDRVLEFKQIKDLFVHKTSFKSKIYDIFENHIIHPLVKADEFIIKKFYWIQSGNTQRYLWYSVVTLIVSLALVLGDKI